MKCKCIKEIQSRSGTILFEKDKIYTFADKSTKDEVGAIKHFDGKNGQKEFEEYFEVV